MHITLQITIRYRSTSLSHGPIQEQLQLITEAFCEMDAGILHKHFKSILLFKLNNMQSDSDLLF